MDSVGRVSNNAIPCGSFCKRRAIGHQLNLNPCIDGGGGLVWPFTAAQLKELERQAMIYKYMMASLPVPFHLLTPSLPVSAPSLSPCNDEKVRVGLKGGDMEPGRCRRTDGKKWRCSKEVVANHKYCERHLHRGRSRSRKPVEPSSASPRNRNGERRNNGHVFRASSSYPETIDNKNGLFIKKDGNFEPLISSSSSYRDSQSFNWEMKGDSLAIIDPPEENWFGYKFKTDNLSCTTMNAGEETVTFHSYADIPSCPDFIDIWSNKTSGVQDRTTNPVSRTPVSSATSGQMDLSLAAEDEMNRIQISLGITGSVKEDDSCIVSSNWVAPVPPGGPLGEMLWPSFVVVGDGDSCITLGTMKSTSSASSPSGVLKQALAFHTDSSSNSSPTQSGRG